MKKMKKSMVALVAAVLIVAGIASAALAGDQKWACSRYYHGEWTGWTTIWASSHDDAMRKAAEFYKDYTYDSLKCE